MFHSLVVLLLLLLLNNQLTRVTGAEYVFLLPILTSNDEGLIQVVGDRILAKEMRFAVSNYLVVWICEIRIGKYSNQIRKLSMRKLWE